MTTELAGLIARTLDVDAVLVTREASFADLGRGSAEEVELFVEIEDLFRIRLDFETYANLATVGELADAIIAAGRDVRR